MPPTSDRCTKKSPPTRLDKKAATDDKKTGLSDSLKNRQSRFVFQLRYHIREKLHMSNNFITKFGTLLQCSTGHQSFEIISYGSG